MRARVRVGGSGGEADGLGVMRVGEGEGESVVG